MKSSNMRKSSAGLSTRPGFRFNGTFTARKIKKLPSRPGSKYSPPPGYPQGPLTPVILRPSSPAGKSSRPERNLIRPSGPNSAPLNGSLPSGMISTNAKPGADSRQRRILVALAVTATRRVKNILRIRKANKSAFQVKFAITFSTATTRRRTAFEKRIAGFWNKPGIRTLEHMQKQKKIIGDSEQ